MMKTDERKRIILNTLITDYINGGEAMSSQSLVERTKLDVSSATMRNDLASLESDGFVRHLHTSSGRVPTSKGYRFYVDQLLRNEDVLSEEKEVFERALSDVSISIDKLLVYSTTILSEISSHPVIMVSESLKRNIIKFVQLVLLNVHQLLVVVLNNYGVNFEEIITLDGQKIDQETLNKMTEYLNRLYQDMPLEDLGNVFERSLYEVAQRFVSYEEMMGKIANVVQRSPRRLASKTVVIKNERTLLSFPEFQDIQSLRQVMTVLESEKKVCDMFLTNERPGQLVQSCIGEEHQNPDLATTSLVYSNVMVGDQKVASIGILGPTRMNYDKMFHRVGGLLTSLKDKMRILFN